MEFDKSKVYTALNADGSLIGAKGYFADKIIDLRILVKKESDIGIVKNVGKNGFEIGEYKDWNFFYLVEPAPYKPKYRPFKDCDELIDTYYKKLNHKIDTKLELPTIWVKDKDSKCQIVSFSKCCSGDMISLVKGAYAEMIYLNELFEEYIFLDGSVCGVEE